MIEIPDNYEFGAGVFDATPREIAMELHAWLRGALPASASEIMREILLVRRAVPGCESLPADAVELSVAIRALEREGLLEQRGGFWFWLTEKPKQEASAQPA